MDALDTRFHQLHQQDLLILTNVADATGARLVEQLGGNPSPPAALQSLGRMVIRTATPCLSNA